MHETNERIPVDQHGTHLAIRRITGTGPVIILVHGITSGSTEFDNVLPELATFSQPIVIDLRGHGSSDKPTAGYGYRHYVDDLTALIRELDLQKPIVLGHSLGGIVTMFWAAENPGVADAFIIEDSPLRSGEGFREAFEGWLHLNALPREALRAFYADRHPDWNEETLEARTTSMNTCARPAILELMELSMSNQGLDSGDELSRITDSVLFLHGDPATGSMVHPEDALGLPTMIADVSVRGVEGAGHSIHRSHPREWTGLVRDFVESRNS